MRTKGTSSGRAHYAFCIKAVAALLAAMLLVLWMPENLRAAAEALERTPKAQEAQSGEEAQEKLYDVIGEDTEKRDAVSKHFILRDKSRVAVTYASPVHFIKNGKWVENEPGLVQKNGRLHNTQGAFSASFALSGEDEGGSVIQWEGKSVSFRALGNRVGGTSQARVSNASPERTGLLSAQELLKSNSGTVSYDGVFTDASLEYKIAWNGIKEDIIIASRGGQYKYGFVYTLSDGLEMSLNSAGDAEISDSEGVVFIIPAPYICDALGDIYYDAFYTLRDAGNGVYGLIVNVDAEYMKTAALPVRVDPAIFIKRITDEGGIKTAYLASGSKNGEDYSGMTNLGKDKKILYAGYESSAYKWCRTYISVELPQLSGSDTVTGAYIKLMQKQGRYNSDTAAEEAIGIAQVKRTWNAETLTWNMQKDDNFGAFLDYQYDVRSKKPNSQYYYDVPVEWNVTEAVKQWYAADELVSCAEGNSSNFGFVLRGVRENISASSPTAHAIYYNDRTTTQYAPCLIVEYRNAKGLEDYWSFHSQSAGRAGSARVNDHTGNLVFVHPDASTPGGRNPVSVSHVYNSYDANREDSVIPCGKGWRLNIAQTVKPSPAAVAADYPYVYTDADGTEHYFIKDGTLFRDEDGLGYRLSVLAGGYTLQDSAGSKLTFDASGRLSGITDTNQNTSTVTYSQTGIRVQDAAGAYIDIMLSGGRVASVRQTDGKSISYSYDEAGHLTGITYPDGKTSLYTYMDTASQADNANPLVRAADPFGYCIEYSYTSDRALRVSGFSEKAGQTPGAEVRISYGLDASTTFTSPGADGEFDTEDDVISVFQFDSYGHTTACYSRLSGSVNRVLGAQSYGYDCTDYSRYTAANNRITSVCAGSTGAVNLLFRPGFETMSGITTTDSAGAVFALNTAYRLQGASSGGITGASESGLSAYVQSFARMRPVKAGRSYTVSAYVRTLGTVSGSGGILIGIAPADKTLSASYYKIISPDELTGEVDGWSRINFTYTCPQDSSANEAYKIYFGKYNLAGTVLFDCAQLEESESANPYSAIGAGDFDWHLSAYPWTEAGISAYKVMPVWGASASGGTESVCTISQTVALTQKDTFTLSAWARAANAVPAGVKIKKVQKASSGYSVAASVMPSFALVAQVNYSDGTKAEYRYDYNAAVDGWQYGAVSFNTASGDKSPVSVTARLEYSHEMGQANFGGVSLVSGTLNSYTYDANGFISGQNDGKSASSTVADEKGNITSSTDENGQTTSYVYDSRSRLISSVSPSGLKTEYTYDGYGNVLSSSGTGGNFPAASGPLEGKTYLIRNRGGNKYFLDSQNDCVMPYTGNAEQLYTLEKAGDYWKIIASDGRALVFTGVTLPMPTFAFAQKDSVSEDDQLFTINSSAGVTSFQPKSVANTFYLTTSSYNGKDVLMALPTMGTLSGQYTWELLDTAYGHPESISSRSEYSQDGRYLALTRDSRGGTVQYTYDPDTGRLLTATDCTGTVSYTYNETGELTGVSKNGASVQYAYENDRLSSITSGSTQYTFEYDGFGNRTKTKVGGALLSRNVYDNVTGLLLETGYGNGTEITFEYDKLGRAVSSSVNGVKTYGYEYDSAGRMLRSYEYGSNRAYEFIYDMRGRLAAKKCTDGSRIIFGYDSKDYLKSSSVVLPGQKLETAYHYGSGSSNQPYKSRVYGVTITDATATKMLINTSSASDRLERLASRSINAVGGKSLVYGYTYERGTTLPLTLSATVGDISSTLVYTYDAAGNITSVTDGENVTRYCYDNMGQLIREDNPYSQKTCVYAYDSCGNILSRTEYGYTDDENPTGGTVTAYEYNNADWGDQLTSWNGESITYDAIGNPLLYRGRSLTWTQGRRLAGITAEGLNVTYTYDESGTRTGKTVNGVSTQYYINGSQILAQKSGENILYFLYDETGSAVGFKYNNNLYIYRKNLQGDILAVLNGQTGAVEASYTYDAWGRVISSTGALANLNPFRYRGYYYDGETGLYYLQSRYYDPETGRFINADDETILDYGLCDIGQYNVFAYCFNSPLKFTDSGGGFPVWLDVAVSVAVPTVITAEIVKGNNYKHNKEAQKNISSSPFLEKQEECTNIKIGFFTSDKNGCGWIAAYNAMILLGHQQQIADVVKYFDGAFRTILFGMFGVAPHAITGYFRSMGFSVSANVFFFVRPCDMDERSKISRACILLYAHNSGAHYVALKWEGYRYTIYNDYVTEAESIDDFLNRSHGTFMMIWFIN